MKNWLFAFCASMALVACSDNSSSSSSLNLDGNFEIVMEKGTYGYIVNEEDSSMVFYEPVCKEGKLKNLVWKEKEDKGDSLQVRYNSKKKTASLKVDDEWESYSYSGSIFPLGIWREDKNAVIQEAMRFEKKQEWQTVFSYKGSCFMEDLYAEIEDENDLVEDLKDEFGEDWSEFQVKNCEEATMYDGLVSIRILGLEESSGKLQVSYKSKSCPASFTIRYAIEEADCKAAYDEFLLDKSAEDFDFEDYNVVSSVDDYCLAELMIYLHKDLNIPLEDETWLAGKVHSFAKKVGKSFF